MQVEAKYPALLFKQQLDAFVQKIFPMLRDNVKKEITPHLAACIHAPRAAATRTRRSNSITPPHSDGAHAGGVFAILTKETRLVLENARGTGGGSSLRKSFQEIVNILTFFLQSQMAKTMLIL